MFKIRSKYRTRKEQEELARAGRAAFIRRAASWHGYVPKPAPVVRSESHPDYLLPEVPIPKALHAQHRLVGEERYEGRKRRE